MEPKVEDVSSSVTITASESAPRHNKNLTDVCTALGFACDVHFVHDVFGFQGNYDTFWETTKIDVHFVLSFKRLVELLRVACSVCNN